MGKLRGMKKLQVKPWSYLIGNHMCRSGFISKPATPQQVGSNAIIKVIKSDGTVIMYDRAVNVSALVLKFPNHKICNSESLYIGKKISALSEDDQLQLGHDYFLLPIHFFDSALSFVTVTSFASKISNIKTPSLSNCQLFEIQKTESGFLKIRVRQEFIFRLIEADENRKKMMLVEKNITKTPSNNNTWVKEIYYKIDDDNEANSLLSNNNISGPLCTTPELWKEYKQLVLVKRSRPWKPKLKIIREAHGSETKSCSNRKRVALLLVAASFRVKWRSSGVTPVNKSSSRTSTIHKMKNKKK
ncbi:hypothetical protein POM88_028388 [Heracleum sosnowskyi]|uniref:DUF4228 domain protein n=1 Tax=Heracleum sosnowskyi TaxID=360622 RepID=A0AAD8IAT1_9APIA|nr:hypothetical protein POM88_028388 [Heracleum sosnowskyi]